MPSSDEIEALKVKRICADCVGEPFLSDGISATGKVEICSYCNDQLETISIEELAEHVELAFEQHYARTADQPTAWQYSMLSDRDSSYEWYRDGDPVIEAIENAADIPGEAAADVQAVLEDRHSDFDSAMLGEESEFDADSQYEEKGASAQSWHIEWTQFERALKTEARFFSQSASDHLKAVFDGLHAMRTHDGRPMIIKAGPGTDYPSLYRARVFQSTNKLLDALCRPDQQLGSPPPEHASAGRMNAQGISVFYGATEAAIALAEVRPPVGSRVGLAQFEIVRPIQLLDLTALDSVSESGSIFDPTYADRLERAVFLRSLGERITRPVMPDDQIFEYLPTQAVADFLATAGPNSIDGILFSSAQAAGNGVNAVLFHKAALVEALDLPLGTKIDASEGYDTEDGWEEDYSVSEEVPANDKKSPTSGDSEENPLWMPSEVTLINLDEREVTLRINPPTVEVHLVTKVEVHTTKSSVRRNRWVRQPRKF